MPEMTRAQFEQFVHDGIAAIPEKFRARIGQVAFLVEDDPTEDQLRENGVPENETLLGLFEGHPIGSEDAAPWRMPPTITLFVNPILDEGVTPEGVERVIRETVWHEVAHYLGMEEDEVRTAERHRAHD